MALGSKYIRKFTGFHEINVLFAVKISVNLAMFREIQRETACFLARHAALNQLF